MSSSRRSKSRRIKQWLANLLVAVLGLIALFLLVGLFLPHHYLVARSIDIRAKPEAVFPFLSEVRRWPEWTVWNRDMDPTIEWTYGTPDTGAGASYRWTGKKGRAGQPKLTQAAPAKGISYELEFDNGKYLSSGAIAVSTNTDHITVTWSNEGDLGKNPVNRYLGLFMDRMMGPDFEKGLANLKAKAEGTSGAK